MIDSKSNIIWSDHALARINEMGLDRIDAECMLIQSTVLPPNFGRTIYKMVNYGDRQNNVIFYRFNNFVFTINDTRFKKVIITVTKKDENIQKY